MGKYSETGLTGNDFTIVRYNNDGSLDNTFGTGGKVITDIQADNDSIQSIVIQSDGKIIAAGYTDNGNDDDIAIVRYNTDGSIDTTFGNNGKIITAILGNDRANSVVVQSDGKITIAGNSHNRFAVVRYNSNGSLDNTFGIGGVVTTNIRGNNDIARSLSIQSDNKIVVGGVSSDGSYFDFAAVRYNSDGSIDTNFGNNGKVITAIGSFQDQAYSIKVQSNAKIVIAGSSDITLARRQLAVVRYNSDGTLDSNFGSGGIVTTTIGNIDDLGYAMAIQSDGNIVVAGSSNNALTNDTFAVVRYIAEAQNTQVNNQVRIRLISDNQPITISGNNPYAVAGLTSGKTEGVKTTGIILDTANNSDMTHDDMLRKLGFDGSLYGTKETSGANNQASNDIAVISRSYLSSSPVTDESLSDGDININNIKIGSSFNNVLYYGTNAYTILDTTAMSKSQAINDKINQTGVQAKAVTKVEIGINGTINTATINGITVSGNPANAGDFANSINNDGNFQKMGIKAEIIGNNNLVRIIADDGRDLIINGDVDMTLNNVAMTANAYTFKGNMIFSNAQAMVNGQGQIQAGYINSGDLVVNGIAIPRSGSLIVSLNDNDNALLDMINNS